MPTYRPQSSPRRADSSGRGLRSSRKSPSIRAVAPALQRNGTSAEASKTALPGLQVVAIRPPTRPDSSTTALRAVKARRCDLFRFAVEAAIPFGQRWRNRLRAGPKKPPLSAPRRTTCRFLVKPSTPSTSTRVRADGCDLLQPNRGAAGRSRPDAPDPSRITGDPRRATRRSTGLRPNSAPPAKTEESAVFSRTFRPIPHFVRIRHSDSAFCTETGALDGPAEGRPGLGAVSTGRTHPRDLWRKPF
jgi:hypothetical protein